MDQMVYRYKDPSGDPSIPALGIRFEYQSQQNGEQTRSTGYPVFDNVLVACVFPMGNAKSDVVHEIERTLMDGQVITNKFYAHKYAEQIKLFKAGNETEGGGTPLSEMGGLSAAIIATFKARGIHSIEALDEAAEVAINDLMGIRKYKEMAKAFLEARKGNAPMVKLAADKAELEGKLEALQRNFDDLVSRLGDGKNKGGRPRKQEQEAA